MGKIRHFFSTDAANKLAVSFIRLYYCNSLLANLPDNKLSKLQHIQNDGAQIVFHKPNHASATSLFFCFKTLQWFQLKPGSSTKLLACVFSVCVVTLCHLIFLTFFIHITHLGCCALLKPLCLQFLASVLRPLAQDLCVLLHCVELPTVISHESSVFFSFQNEAKSSSV